MRDHLDNNSMWAKTVIIFKAKFFDRDLQIPDLAFRIANVSPNFSNFFPKLTHCTGEDAEELHDTLK